jgi:hypothetical protein
MAKFQTPMICNKQATDTRVAVNYRLVIPLVSHHALFFLSNTLLLTYLRPYRPVIPFPHFLPDILPHPLLPIMPFLLSFSPLVVSNAPIHTVSVSHGCSEGQDGFNYTTRPRRFTPQLGSCNARDEWCNKVRGESRGMVRSVNLFDTPSTHG